MGEPQRAHEGNIEALVFSPDGKRLLSRASDATARLWDVDSWQPHGPPLQQQGLIGGIAFSPDGTLVTVGSGHNITIWRVGARQRLARDLRTEQRPRAVAISPDGGRLLAGFDQGRVQLWDLDRQQPVGPPVRALPENMAVYEARFRPDGGR